jgi:uncharacterized membrane protein (UPF0127 family)
MNQKTEKIIVSIIAVIFAILIIFFVQNVFSITKAISSSTTIWKGGVQGTLSSSQFRVVGTTTSTVANSLEWSVPGKTITLLIAATPAQQELGLGGIRSLSSTSGMFFVFEKSDDYGFWMKDMKFPLDIIWLDQNFKIIHIEYDLSPSTYPQVFYPGSPAKYVIEVNAGTAAEFSLTIGEMMQIYQK